MTKALEYLRKSRGDALVDEVLGLMSEEAREGVTKALVTSWYPAEYRGEFLRAIRMVLGDELGPDANFIISLETAKATYSAFHKIFFKLGSPHFVINRAASVWGTLASEGKLEIVAKDRKSVTVRLTDFSYRNPEFCAQLLRAYQHAALELSGCKITKSEHPRCRSAGADCCEWHYAWE